MHNQRKFYIKILLLHVLFKQKAKRMCVCVCVRVHAHTHMFSLPISTKFME